MKPEKLIGKKVNGFKFEDKSDFKSDFKYMNFMDALIGKEGVIKRYNDSTKGFVVDFGIVKLSYPADQIEAHLVEDEETIKEEIKQAIQNNKILICTSDLKVEDEIPTLSDGVMMLVSDDDNYYESREVYFKYNGKYYAKPRLTMELTIFRYAKPLEPTKEEQLKAILGSSDKVSEIMELFKN